MGWPKDLLDLVHDRSSVEARRDYRRSPPAPTAPLRTRQVKSGESSPISSNWHNWPKWGHFGALAPNGPKIAPKTTFYKSHVFSRFLTFSKRRYYSTGKLRKSPFLGHSGVPPLWALFWPFLAKSGLGPQNGQIWPFWAILGSSPKWPKIG